MIQPSLMIEKVVALLIANKADIGINGADEVSEDWSKNLKPPYCLVYADTDEETDYQSAAADLIDVPITINIMCCSGEGKTAKETFDQAWAIARKVLQYAHSDFTFNQADLETDPGKPTQTVQLRPKKMPREISSKTAKQSVVITRMYYYDPQI